MPPGPAAVAASEQWWSGTPGVGPGSAGCLGRTSKLLPRSRDIAAPQPLIAITSGRPCGPIEISGSPWPVTLVTFFSQPVKPSPGACACALPAQPIATSVATQTFPIAIRTPPDFSVMARVLPRAGLPPRPSSSAARAIGHGSGHLRVRRDPDPLSPGRLSRLEDHDRNRATLGVARVELVSGEERHELGPQSSA